MVRMLVCVCAWVHACVCMLKIVSMDKILYFTNTLLLLLNKRVKYHYVNEQHNINKRERDGRGGERGVEGG